MGWGRVGTPATYTLYTPPDLRLCIRHPYICVAVTLGITDTHGGIWLLSGQGGLSQVFHQQLGEQPQRHNCIRLGRVGDTASFGDYYEARQPGILCLDLRFGQPTGQIQAVRALALDHAVADSTDVATVLGSASESASRLRKANAAEIDNHRVLESASFDFRSTSAGHRCAVFRVDLLIGSGRHGAVSLTAIFRWK